MREQRLIQSIYFTCIYFIFLEKADGFRTFYKLQKIFTGKLCDVPCVVVIAFFSIILFGIGKHSYNLAIILESFTVCTGGERAAIRILNIDFINVIKVRVYRATTNICLS